MGKTQVACPKETWLSQQIEVEIKQTTNYKETFNLTKL